MHDFPILLFTQGFKFQDFSCNAFHDLAILSVNISDIAIITIKKCWLRFIVVLFLTLAIMKQLIY